MTAQIDNIDFSQVCIQPNEVEYVIYHGGCVDGFSSALCAWKYFGDKQPVYHAGRFGILPPLDEVKGKCVLICDFSYKWDLLRKLRVAAKKLLILDHHKTAQEDLANLPAENKIFRMDHSGAYLSWRFFFRDVPVPRGILYVEDNDIWKKEMPDTIAFSAYVHIIPFTFEDYSQILDDSAIDTIILPGGRAMEQQNNRIIEKAVKNITPSFVQLNNKYYFVGYLNTTELKSEIGNKAFQYLPNINFAAVYSCSNDDDNTYFSLRSINTATDVSQIASLFNGGGHRNASGVCINMITNKLPCTVIDNKETYKLLDKIYVNEVVVNDVTLNVVYLCSSHYKVELGKYLLQTRYSDIQECVSIMINRAKANHTHEDINISYDVAAIWSYDGFSNKTDMVLCYKDSTTRSLLEAHFKEATIHSQSDYISLSIDNVVSKL